MTDITAQQRGVKAFKEPENHYWMMAIGLLSIRIIQGFVYWGGGSRRFIYGIHKLDYTAPHWMANKFQSAMLGAIMGFEYIVSFIVQHFWILYPAIILFSAAELFVGLFLMIGLYTRICAFISMLFSVLLMFLFGWQGATCIDEWTMAACNLAMGTTILLCGSNVYSVDNILLRKKPSRGDTKWFRWICGSLPMPLSSQTYKKLGLWLLAFVVVFDLSTYSHYRGSVITPFHSGPVSPTVHHLTLINGVIHTDGSVSFHAYLDAGTAEANIRILDAWILNANGNKIGHWDTQQLSALPKDAFKNDYDYNIFKPAPYGFQAEMGAKATITLPPVQLEPDVTLQKPYSIELKDATGKSFKAELKLEGALQSDTTGEQ